MALSDRAIEQLSRDPSRTPGWSSRLLMFSGTIFFVSLGVYIGIQFGYKPYLEEQVKLLNDQIQGFSQKISEADQAKIIRFYSQASNLKFLLDNHIFSSQLFSWLERNTQTNTFFSRASLSVSTRQLEVDGSSRSALDATQQLEIFQKQPEVERINFSNLKLGPSGLWEFKMIVFFTPQFLRQVARPAEGASEDTTPTTSN